MKFFFRNIKNSFDNKTAKNIIKNSNKLLNKETSYSKEAGFNNKIATPTDTLKIADSMPETCKTLFVKNLPYDMKEDDIGDRFRPFGEI